MNRQERAAALGLTAGPVYNQSISMPGSSEWNSRSISRSISPSGSRSLSRSESRSLSRSRSRSSSPEPGAGGVTMEILVDNEPVHKFEGPGESGYEHETWTYVVAIPETRYMLRFDNMQDDAQDVVVEIRIDGVLQSRKYELPRHRSKVKQGKTDGSANLYPWQFGLTKYVDPGDEDQGGGATVSDLSSMGCVSAKVFAAVPVQEWDDDRRGGGRSVEPEQVQVEESEFSRKAKYTTTYGEVEGLPQREPRPGMKNRLMPMSKYDKPLGEIKYYYRDLDTLTKRRIVSELYNPPWLGAYRRKEAEKAAQQMQLQARQREQTTINLEDYPEQFSNGEVVDLT